MLDLLIDLDNTVYPEDSNIFGQIDLRMKSFISKNLGVSLQEAFKIQKKYFLKNGTTLRGLMLYHNIEPDNFLKYVHDINLKSIKKNFKLMSLIKKFKGKKIIFTNGSYDHAQKVLKKVGINIYIDHIFDIVNAEYIPKPEIRTYKKVLKKFSLNPMNTIMIDDIPNNLKSAKILGIKTVLIKKNLLAKNNFSYIDLVSKDLSDTLLQINKGF